MKIFEIKQGNVLPTNSIAAECGLEQSLVLDEIRAKVDHYTYQFGVKPLAVEYQAGKGFVLRAESQIGYLVTPNFVIRIQPKVENISLTKILLMAQKTNSGFLDIQNDRLNAALTSDGKYSNLDLLAISFLDKVDEIVRNGLMYEWDTKVDPASTNKGQIDLNQWAAQGKSMPIPRSEIEPDCDIIVNRFLKATLLHIKQSISIESVQSIAITCLGYFDGVSSAQINDCRSQVEQQFYNYPRQDYKLAVGFAEAIVDGGYFTDSAQGNQMPSFILDMNVVFEKYCAYMIKRQLDPQLYEVEIQSEYPHCSKPELSGAIQPDIVVRHKESEKCIVLDTKNKVVKFFDSPAGRLPNQDIFQLVYYSQTLLAVGALLLYPSD